MPSYQPSQEILARYAKVLVDFALNSGQGIKKGEVVMVQVPDIAKPLALELQNAILRSGGHVIMHLLPSGFDKDFFSLASEEQLKFFPDKYLQERVKLIDHSIGIIADTDMRELASIDPQKLMLTRNAKAKYREWLQDKEYSGKFTWTLAMWGTAAMAAEAKLSEEEYWQQIIDACFLDSADPVAEWRKVAELQIEIKRKLNELPIKRLHVEGADADLWLTLGEYRAWIGGSGRNIPSFEIFTSPDWRGSNGWIRFNQPIYRYGNEISGVEFNFQDGILIKASAKIGNELLQAMIQTENANKVGEYSLTDKRMSRITKFMAEILFDENVGGPFGNTHLAIGSAFKDCYAGDPATVDKQNWAKWGYNESPEHTDFISTVDRTVTAELQDGSSVVIYQDGMFIL